MAYLLSNSQSAPCLFSRQIESPEFCVESPQFHDSGGGSSLFGDRCELGDSEEVDQTRKNHIEMAHNARVMALGC